MDINELAQKYELKQEDWWDLGRGNKHTWIITHAACEKIAAKEGIILDDLEIINSKENFCRVKVTMSMTTKDKGEKKIITIGEALLTDGRLLSKTDKYNKQIKLGNCESQYIGMMAEKRGIDRAILKLIDAYQYGIYSDSEADDFKKEEGNNG